MSAPPGWLAASLQSCSRLRTSFTSTLSVGSATGREKRDLVRAHKLFNFFFLHRALFPLSSIIP